jgi:hypothetical protein
MSTVFSNNVYDAVNHGSIVTGKNVLLENTFQIIREHTNREHTNG